MGIIQERIVNQGHGPLIPSYFCVHSTANPGATAANHASLWSDYPNAVHLVSDWTEALHCVPYDRLCWQVGNGNRYVEGLEICEATNQADFQRGIEIAAQVVSERLAAHGWGIDRLICHNEASARWGGSDHIDPIPYFAKWGYSWEQFKQLVDKGGTGVSSQDLYDTKGNDGRNIFDSVIQSRYDIAELKTMLAAQTATIETLAKSIGADPNTIADTVRKAVETKLATLDIQITTTEKDTKE